MKKFGYFLIFFSVIYAAFFIMNRKSDQPESNLQVYSFNLPLIATTLAGQEVRLGGISSLNFIKKENDDFVFEAITDRGPNAEEIALIVGVGRNTRPFVLPDYKPELLQLKFNTKTKNITVMNRFEFKDREKFLLTGLPYKRAEEKRLPASKRLRVEQYELALDLNGNKLNYLKEGMDSEGFCRTGKNIFVSEEYGPDLLKFDENMHLIKRYRPGAGLPSDYAKRKQNRGFEGLACDKDYVYVAMQSPLNSGLEKDQGFIRIAKFSISEDKIVKEYFYPVKLDVADKIGDIALLPNGKLLVVEQNGKLEKDLGYRRIFEIDLNHADAQSKLSKTEIADLNKLGFDFVEKIEGIAILDNKTIALSSDNDFGLEGFLDTSTGLVKMKPDQNNYLALIKLEKNLY